MNLLENRRSLVVGGAGFVGSNLVRALLERGSGPILVVDNLLSAERENLPDDERVTLVEGSITDDGVLAGLPDDLDYVFHLATYHGNQSSMADPLADHENNTLTTLKLYERLKDIERISKVVYASAGCTVAEKTFDEAEATSEDAPVSLYLDSPYQISKIIGEYYSNYYFGRHGLPVGQGALPERLRPGRDPRRRALARHGQHGLAQRHPDLHLQGDQGRGAAGRERRHRHPRLDLRRRHRRRADRLRRAGRGRAASTTSPSGAETTILELAERSTS